MHVYTCDGRWTFAIERHLLWFHLGRGRTYRVVTDGKRQNGGFENGRVLLLDGKSTRTSIAGGVRNQSIKAVGLLMPNRQTLNPQQQTWNCLGCRRRLSRHVRARGLNGQGPLCAGVQAWRVGLFERVYSR